MVTIKNFRHFIKFYVRNNFSCLNCIYSKSLTVLVFNKTVLLFLYREVDTI